MANGPKDKLRNLNKPEVINISFNEVLKIAISSTDLPCYSQLAGVLRFNNNECNISSLRYKMVILMDNVVYCYGKLYSYTILDLNNYRNKIEFKTNQLARSAWDEIVKTPIIRYGTT